ncbi:hypothetical protein GPECTOR_147g10 [Gonium pectorale]|uniref:Uncharacterized protein n=1 Tax=Gonium pectorale TaxID=33097 RepID=A0A150FXV1_GONPE|nr:hypothetical protein GPECTOR_147g10 [Gonium pectorale]|eukprot:KXZ42426.1 hypothetical protein GPECTOR_147g10 [Gonium pectorale]
MDHPTAENGHLEVVKELLAKGANVNAATEFGWTPLRAAASKGHLKLVKELLAAGADVKSVEEKERAPLHDAAYKGHLEVVKELLAAGADVHAVDEEVGTPLHVAASKGHLEVVKELLAAKGADVKAATWDLGTPLHVAASEGHLEVVKKLLAKGANVNAASKYAGTPLHGAASEGHMEVVKELWMAGADVNAAAKPSRISAEEGEVGSEQEREEAMPAPAVAEAAATLGDQMVTLGTGTQRKRATDIEKELRDSTNAYKSLVKENAALAAKVLALEQMLAARPHSSATSSQHSDDSGDSSTSGSSGGSKRAEKKARNRANKRWRRAASREADQRENELLDAAVEQAQREAAERAQRDEAAAHIPRRDGAAAAVAAEQAQQPEEQQQPVDVAGGSGAAASNAQPIVGSSSRRPCRPPVSGLSDDLVALVEEQAVKVIGLMADTAPQHLVVQINGETPAYVAACKGHLEVVKVLRAAGADVNAADKDGWTPLQLAASNTPELLEAWSRTGVMVKLNATLPGLTLDNAQHILRHLSGSVDAGFKRLVHKEAYRHTAGDLEKLAHLCQALEERQCSGTRLPAFVGRHGVLYGLHELEMKRGGALEGLYYPPSRAAAPMCYATMIQDGEKGPISQRGVAMLCADVSSLILLLLTVGGGVVAHTQFPWVKGGSDHYMGSVQLMPELRRDIRWRLPSQLTRFMEAEGWPVAVALGLARGGTAAAWRDAFELIRRYHKDREAHIDALHLAVQEAAYFALVQPPPQPLHTNPLACCLDLGSDDEVDMAGDGPGPLLGAPPAPPPSAGPTAPPGAPPAASLRATLPGAPPVGAKRAGPQGAASSTQQTEEEDGGADTSGGDTRRVKPRI